MAYATLTDIQSRMVRTLSTDEQAVVTSLLDDAAVMIDAYKAEANVDAKKVVSCRMVIRAIGDGDSMGIPMGATQGAQGGLGYSNSWTFGSGGSAGELYLSKQDRDILGRADAIGSYSPVQGMTGVSVLWD